MCGRFYIDDDLKEELDKMLADLNEQVRVLKEFHAGEVFPSDYTAVITKKPEHAELIQWGYPGYGKQKVLFNARSETALQKRTFEQGFLHNRCVIPVSGFYEWDKSKCRFYFRQKGADVMYLGAIWDTFADGKRFTILTREADEIMEPVHSRMPVIIDKENCDLWLNSLKDAKRMVYERQPEIYGEAKPARKKGETAEYEQIHIFNTFNL